MVLRTMDHWHGTMVGSNGAELPLSHVSGPMLMTSSPCKRNGQQR